MKNIKIEFIGNVAEVHLVFEKRITVDEEVLIKEAVDELLLSITKICFKENIGL